MKEKTKKKVKYYIHSNRTTILSIIEMLGVVGVGIVSYLTGKNVSKKIEELKAENPEITRKEIFKEVWYYLLPMFGSITGVIVIIFMNEKLNKKQKTELLTSVAMASGMMAASQGKKERTVEDPADNEFPTDDSDIMVPVPSGMSAEHSSKLKDPYAEDVILCCDTFTGRYFWATEAIVADAENKYREIICTPESYGCGYNEFYGLLGICTSDMGDIFGDICDDCNGDGNIDPECSIFRTQWARTENGQKVLMISRTQELLQYWYEY